MTKRHRDHELGSRAAAIANAKARAREEDRPIFVLEYLDGEERTYTSSVHSSLMQQRTRLHGRAEKHGRRVVWIPQIIMNLDDVIAYLSVMGEDTIADQIDSRRGDREGS